jgi:TrkA-N domain
VPQVPRRLNQHRDHLIVCGDDALAYRVVEELTVNYGERVTVLLSSAARGYGPRIAQLPGVRVIERPDLDAEAFTAAQAQSARAMALTRQDDLGNFHAALRAQDLNPDLRLVMRIFNAGLGERMRSFFPDCAVLSSSSMAAPSFVAAALGEPAPSHVRLAGRTLYVARRSETERAHFVCGLATTDQAVSPQLLPPGPDAADLVLAVADGTPRNPLTRPPRRLLRALAGLPHLLFGHKLGAVFLTLFAVLVGGFALLVTPGGFSPGRITGWPRRTAFTFWPPGPGWARY